MIFHILDIGRKGGSHMNRIKKDIQFPKQVFLIMIVVLTTVYANTQIFMLTYIPSGSMMPTVNIHNFVLGTRQNLEKIERYDIVIFRFPDDETQYYIKRVIGLPGEDIEIVDGIVYADGVRLIDDFVMEISNDSGEYHVPEDHYFMLGDNRNNSKDSRFWDKNYVMKNKICAKAVSIIYPLCDFKILN